MFLICLCPNKSAITSGSCLKPIVFLFMVYAKRKGMKITRDIEMRVAGGLANFVRDDTLVDTTMGMTHRADDQAVDVTDYRRKQGKKGYKVYWSYAT